MAPLEERTQPLQTPQHRQDDDEEHQRVGRADLQPHGGVAVGQAHRQGAGEWRVEHPGEIELAHREREHHQAAGHDGGHHRRHQPLACRGG